MREIFISCPLLLQASCLYRIIGCYDSTISFPKGANAKAASLKCCIPKGIPMTVIHSNTPKPKCERQIHIPPRKIHNTFISMYRQPPERSPLRTSLPKGHRASPANYIVCIPKGMPTGGGGIGGRAGGGAAAGGMPPNTSHKTFIRQLIALHFYVLHCKDTILLVLSE